MSERLASPFMVTVLPILSQNANDYTYGVLTDGEKVLVICTEGVSWEVTDEKPWVMEYPSGEDFGISRESLISLVCEGENVVSLDKFVRSFGARLECNYRLASQWCAKNFHGVQV